MRNLIQTILAPFLLLLLLFVDGQLTTLATNLSSFGLNYISYICLICLVFFPQFFALPYLFLVFISFGLFYDYFYFHLVGIATVSWPILAWFIYRLRFILKTRRWTNFLLYFIIVFAFSFMSYLISLLLGLTHLRLEDFIFYTVAPSLFFNFIMFVFIWPIIHVILQGRD